MNRLPGTRTRRVLLALVVASIAAALGRRVRLDEDVSRLLPDTSPELERATLLMRHVLERAIVDLEAPERAEEPVALLADAADEIVARLLASGSVASARARVGEGDVLPVLDLLRERAPRLLDGAALESLAPRLEPAAVRDRIVALARRLQEPDGVALASRAAEDPLGVADLALAPLDSLTAGFAGARLVDGRIVSEDMRHMLLLVEPGFPASDTARTRRFLRTLEEATRDLAAEPRFAGLRVAHLGTHRSTVDNAERLRRDVLVTAVAGFLLVVALAYLAFGRISVSLLSATPALFGGVVALGAFSLFGRPLAAAAAGFGSVLLGVTIDYAVHVLWGLRRGESAAVPVAAVLMGAATTAAAFLGLSASSLPGVRDMGIFGAIGIAAAAAFAVLVLPALVASRASPRAPLDLAGFIGRLRSPRADRALLLGALAFTPLLALGALRVSVDGDVTHLSSLSRAAEEDEARVRRVWGAAFRVSTAVVGGADLEQALEANDRLARLLRARHLSGFGSLAGILPSRRTQQERLDRWRAFWSDGRVESVRRSLAEAATDTPFRPDAFEPFLAWVRADPPPLDPAELAEGALHAFLAERLVRVEGGWIVGTPVFAKDFAEVEALASALRREEPGALLINGELLVRSIGRLVVGETVRLGAYAFLAVALLSFLWQGRLEIAGVVLLPLLLSCLWTLGLLGWLGHPLSLANAVFVCLLFGLAVDYSIFLANGRLESFRAGQDRTRESEASVLLCALTTCAGFGVLLLAGHPVLYSIGATAVAGISSALLATYVFVPALARVFLRGRGPNGSPGIAQLWAAARVHGGLRWGAASWAVRRLALPASRRREAAYAALKKACLRLRRSMPLGRRVYEGEGRLRPGSLLLSNHESPFDAALLLALPVAVRFAGDPAALRGPLPGRLVRDAGLFLAADEVQAHVAAGGCVAILPAERSAGCARVADAAHDADAAILAVALVNTRSVMSPGGWWIGDHDALVSVVGPVEAPPGADLCAAACGMVEAAAKRLRIRTQTGPFWHRPVAGIYRYLGPTASHYAASKLKRDPLFRALPELCAGAQEVLVAGCGLGIATSRLALADPAMPLLAVDSDERKVAVARAALGGFGNVTFRVGDVRDVDLGSPDLALAVDLLHYWPDAAQREILARIVRALRPGGRLLFRDGCSDEPLHRLVHAGERFARLVRFTRTGPRFHFRSRAGWCSLLTECGLKVVSASPDLGRFSNTVLDCRKR